MAWVLPHNFLYAQYGKQVMEFLSKHFSCVKVVEVQERVFSTEGTCEGTVLLTADGWDAHGENQGSIDLMHAVTIQNANRLLNVKNGGRLSSQQVNLNLSDKTALALGQIGTIRIGLVTGNLKFFVFDADKQATMDIPHSSLRSLVHRADWHKGLHVTKDDSQQLFKEGKASKILDTTQTVTPSVEKYLQRLSSDIRAKNVTFKKRKIWHQPFDGHIADAFFTSMSHLNPRIIINKDGLDCVNNMYRIKFSDGVGEHEKMMVAISMISTLGQLSCELEGRPYGSGLLKHEPSDVRRIKVWVKARGSIDLEKAYDQIHHSLISGNIHAALNRADEVLLDGGLASRHEIYSAKIQLAQLRHQRLKSFSTRL